MKNQNPPPYQPENAGMPQNAMPPPPYYQQAVGEGQPYYPPGAVPTVVPVTTTVVLTRGCPKCQNGIMQEVSNVLSIVLIVMAAILFFPIGLAYLFCLPASTSYRCTNCGYEC